MATLTTSWASYASASWVGSSGVTVTFYLEAKYVTQNTGNNTTTIQTRLRSTINSGYSASGSGYNFSCSYCNTVSGTGVWVFKNEVITTSGDKTITHNTDGTKSVSLSATAKNSYLGINKSMSVTVDLPKINRLATVTATNDFTDEENPTLTFDNPAGFDVKPYLNFYDVNNTLVYSLTRNNASTSPYTWEITTAERNAMRSATNQQPSYRVQVGVDTYNNGTKIGYHSISKQMTYVNANPTQAITVTETNQDVIDLLGSSASTIVQNISNLTFAITPTALKSATITKVELDGVPDTTSPYEFANVVPTTNSFVVKTTDSRTLSVETTVTKTLINYEPVDILSLAFTRYAPTSSDVILNAEIKYIQATFGSYANTPTIKWKKGENGTLNTISSSDYTIDTQNNKITINDLTLSNVIAYTDEDTFYLYIEDLLTTDTDYKTVIRGVPTFEAGEHDFQVNGELYIADADRNNRKSLVDLIYPVGSIYISTGATSPATLFGGTWQQIQDTFLLSAGTTYTAGSTGGEATVTLTTAQMPKHRHSLYNGNAGGTITSYNGNNFAQATTINKTYGYVMPVEEAGGDQPHNNMPPYLVVYVWERTA